MRINIKQRLFILLTSIVLMSLAGWTVTYNWRQRPLHTTRDIFSGGETEHLKNNPRALYAYGLKSWTRQDAALAARFFRLAVSKDVLFIDAWIRLAEVEAAMGHNERAKDILTFTLDSTGNAYRWKWPLMVLAGELGLESVVQSHANELLSRGYLEMDTLQFLHTRSGGDAAAVVSVIEGTLLVKYLEWLMNWSMVAGSKVVWNAMFEKSLPQKETALRYANFLLHSKQITEAKEIWLQYNGKADMMNPGFETELTGRGFDWCYWKEKESLPDVSRASDDTREGDYALRIDFYGRENISLYHLYQIVTVDPQATYRLTYAWKSQGITTDQGPYIEIYGYDNEGILGAGPMITGSNEWRDDSLEFEPPDSCRAVVVRLRRQPSHRFDSKISGTLWLDDFRLDKIGRNPAPLNIVRRGAVQSDLGIYAER